MHIILQNRNMKIILVFILSAICVFFMTACGSDAPKPKERITKGGYIISEIEFPFADKLKNGELYYESLIYDDILEVFLGGEKDRKIQFFEWYEYDMLSGKWSQKEFVWNHYLEKEGYVWGGETQYDSKGNLYGVWGKRGEENSENIYQMKDDGTIELYVELSDYMADYEKMTNGWRFLEDDRIISTLKHTSLGKANETVIIDPVKKEMTATVMEEMFIMDNIVFDGDHYIYPQEYERQLCVRRGNMWDVKEKHLTESGIKLEEEDFAPTFPLQKEEDKIYLFSNHGIFSFGSEDEKMKCVISEDVLGDDFSEHTIFTHGYKAKGEDTFFMLAQDDTDKIVLYRIQAS